MAYLNEWGVNKVSNELYRIATDVKDKLKSNGYKGETAFEMIENNKENPDQWEDESESSSGILGSSNISSTTPTVDSIIENAQGFKNAEEPNLVIPIHGDRVESGSKALYNILLSIGIFLSVGYGVYLGVKFMLANAEDKAKIKESLIPYIAGCIVIFGAFTIWKLAVVLVSNVA